jgi:hypothetical protein
MPDPQPVPINAKFDDDFVTQLVVVLNTDTMREVAIKVAQHVVGKRLPKRDASCPPTWRSPRLVSRRCRTSTSTGSRREQRREERCWTRAAHV